ncbi:MAG: pimeloyl-ACP methyl ester carboxylesterase [Alphaproteobacteria bacterium]
MEGQENIILLHGFSASKDSWLRFAAVFEGRYHIVALDLMGHGDNNQDLSQSYTIESQVDYVHKVAGKLGIKRFHIVGNSMGGAISSLYSALYPEQILSAILISPAGIHAIPSKMDELLAQGRNPLIATTPESFDQLIDFVMEDRPFMPTAIIKVEAEKAVSRVAINEKILKDIKVNSEHDMEIYLSRIQAPVLIIWGEHDRVIDVANIEKYVDLIPNAQKLVLEGIGHVAMIEAPELSANAMIRFMPKSFL